MNIVQLLYEAVQRFPDKVALIENGCETPYRDLWVKIQRLSTAFHKIGIKENDRVALLLPNCSEFIYCFFALLKINAIASPLSHDLTTYELQSIFGNLEPHAMIALSSLMEKVQNQNPTLLSNKILILPNDEMLGGQKRSYYTLDELFNLGKNHGIDDNQINDRHPATINYTYRGLGFPLGAVLSHQNYWEGISTYIETTRVSAKHRVISLLPLSHIYPLVGCVLAPLVSGATIVISTNFMPRSIFKLIEEYKINYLTIVPAIYNLLLQYYKKAAYDLRSLTCCITGGAYMLRETIEVISAQMGLNVLQGYGLSECFVVAWNRFEFNKKGTLGLPFGKDIKICIVDENDNLKKMNEVGEIVIKTPAAMQSYYNQQAETQEVLKNGFFYSGDYGYLDDEGYLHFSGLKKRVAKVGGNMVDLMEVKNVLLSHPLISDAYVYSKEDKLWGHSIVTEVVSEGNNQLTAMEIRNYCSQYLSHYKVPKMIDVVEEVGIR